MYGRPVHEVFLSFRGKDTRNHFADFLYTMLTDVRINVFRDEEDLKRGEEVSPQLIQAIENSKMSIPIISEDYANSKSCIMELVNMVDCMTRKNHTIIPIFYNVDPSDVRNSRGAFATALGNQQDALRRIGNLKGHHHVKRSDLYHTEVIKKIVREVEQKLKKRDLTLPKQLVRVDPHVQEIMAKLKVDHCNGQAVNIGYTCEEVLIYGIPGVGKTVLAKCVYNKLHHLYDACSFLENIQATIELKGILSVRNRLISHLHKQNAQKLDCPDKAMAYIQSRFLEMKVLLLLDDVKDSEQLCELLGELDWFGPGSTVIVTSQRDDVLKKYEGAERFCRTMIPIREGNDMDVFLPERCPGKKATRIHCHRFGLGTMNQDKALTLFCKHAFERDSPPENYKELSTKIVAATDGLPLALQKVGDSLSRVKDRKVWTDTLTAWERAPEKSVREAFFKSYNTLEKHERDIFLDIACFFNGKDKRIPDYMWDICNFFPDKSFTSLRAKSLVEIREDKLRMHGILKTFAKEIVENESKNPWKRSRMYDPEVARRLLQNRKGNAIVQALGLEFADGSRENIRFECDRFADLDNLRFLKLDCADIRGDFRDQFWSLRWLDWRGCPEDFDVQSLNLKLQELVILDLSSSQVHKDWKVWELLREARKLKVLKLTGCVQLMATPEFPPSMELERLILEGCCLLTVTDQSFRNLTKLVSLNMKQCTRLSKLPDLGPMSSLKELVIDGTAITRIDFREGSMRMLETLSARDCRNLTVINNSIRYLKSLKYLSLDGSAIQTFRKSIGSLERLKTLSLKNCQRLTVLPDEIGKLRSLESLDISDTKIHVLPTSVKHLEVMKVLRMRGTLIRKFPEAILNLDELEEIDFSLCRRLKGRIPFNIWRMSSLTILKLSDTQISGLPARFSPYRLRELHIGRCSNLQRLTVPEELPFTLIIRDDN